MAAAVEVRRLGPADLGELRRVRLRGLADEPLAFGSTHEHEAAQPDAFWLGWLEHNPPFGAWLRDRLVGLASLSPSTLPNMAHRATLGAMYVEPAHRGSGVAARLVEVALAHGAGLGIEQVHLTVTEGNRRAERFYERVGFVTYGREPRGMKHRGVHHDLVLMVRYL